ncbi:antibiotic biosynthesis monooxygenase family protein [Bacillus sp. T33-2]|uniref:antibiotic biosynthesis monooxygenase family protein n=1 Tax=Bacillus sp. T33-2 TaxID=2054168 RepID=UPI000C7942E1|nr:antibiotic biosynthesis monooxygenase [Bacillus sp. T33-2]PLR97722.1 antibiotic biosynthesis monooxygenase [Bacillus sp. T33-2]
MNLYMASGTYDYLSKLKDSHPDETMLIMGNAETSLLVHETTGKTIFNSPRKYEIFDQAGSFGRAGFAVLNNIPVTDEGRPLFEYRFKNRAKQIENEPGFAAIRVLRPITSNTYVIFTVWENETAFENWQKSKSFENAHKKQGSGQASAGQSIFAGPSYVTKYTVFNDEN